ncbi:hypothetical protein CCH79_00019713 [Gambusia affinis]|uniref:Uncharacterized protein n=1 Tax=Gambusia affinis TaxID=33528 RepID=A0A315V8M8_GAMAF|nr:hypothetical protein CCH79_00019713 [Gambusia affinis]
MNWSENMNLTLRTPPPGVAPTCQGQAQQQQQQRPQQADGGNQDVEQQQPQLIGGAQLLRTRPLVHPGLLGGEGGAAIIIIIIIITPGTMLLMVPLLMVPLLMVPFLMVPFLMVPLLMTRPAASPVSLAAVPPPVQHVEPVPSPVIPGATTAVSRERTGRHLSRVQTS